MGEAKEAMRSSRESAGTVEPPNLAKLTQCKSSLQEKLALLNRLDDEILDLIKEDEVEKEIEQADMFKERMRLVIIDFDNTISSRGSPMVVRSSTTTPRTTEHAESGDIPTPCDSHTDPDPSTTGLPSPGHAVEPLATSLSPHTGSTSHMARVKLPKLTLRKFNGDLTK